MNQSLMDTDHVSVLLEKIFAVLRARKLQEMTLYIFSLIFFLALFWTTILGSIVAEERSAWAAVKKDSEATSVRYNNHHFPETLQVAVLDPKLVPSSSTSIKPNPAEKRRLIFIGDIHGCKKELSALLEKVKFSPSTDHIICTGDIVGKGPDTTGVIDLLRKHRATSVRGNHEDNLLRLVDELESQTTSTEKKTSKDSDQDSSKILPKKKYSKAALARSLSKEQIQYLRDCPLILRIGNIKAMGGQIVVVHAGLVPGLSFNHQDPQSVMNMRLIDIRSHQPSKAHQLKGSIPWFTLWNKYQRLLSLPRVVFEFGSSASKRPTREHTTIIYGHDSRRGLQIKKYTKGLDSGCVRGGQLTALVLADGGRHNIVQVDCRGYR